MTIRVTPAMEAGITDHVWDLGELLAQIHERCDSGGLTRESRHSIRILIWVVLVCCIILDGALGEAAISGCCEVGYVNEGGTWALPGPEPELWPVIMGFILFQALLVMALLRLREPKHSPGLLPSDNSTS